MAHVHYKGEFARPFHAPASVMEEEASVDREIARMARSMRPQLRIPKAVVWALLVSLLSHSAVAIALSVAQVSAPAAVTSQPFNTARTISLDWDLYAGGDSGAAAAVAALDEESAEELSAPEPSAEVAVAAPTPRRERSTRSEDTASALEEEAQLEVPMAPVAALVDDGRATRVAIPTGEQVGTASREHGDAQNQGPHDAQASNPAQAAGIASGSNRQEGAIGDGQGVDLDGIRRGHIASLNRAIRSKNPCTRELSHRGLSGNVVMGLTQRSDGTIDEVRVLRSSGEVLIDDAAKAFIAQQSRLPRPDGHLAGEVWQVGLRFKCGN